MRLIFYILKQMILYDRIKEKKVRSEYEKKYKTCSYRP